MLYSFCTSFVSKYGVTQSEVIRAQKVLSRSRLEYSQVMEKPSSSSSSGRPSEKELTEVTATRTSDSTDSGASGAVTVPSRQAVAGKLFKKCKSATFQIDGATYTIGKIVVSSCLMNGCVLGE